MRNPTNFELEVYAAVRLIPAGNVTTYGRIAQRIARGSARAVGTALARNPFAPDVPCHRVVCANGGLGGFHGHTDAAAMLKKSTMLRAEGVKFVGPSMVAQSAIIA
jgi:methylated-DNA-[protein]-cysteine S-methyltransferase